MRAWANVAAPADPAVPEVIYFKRAVLNIEYEVIPGEETSHSMFYRPNIKAY